jgi:DNA-binding NtrC family response regulator
VAAVSHHPIGSLVEAHPSRAAAVISDTLAKNGGNIGPTAEQLKVHRATLSRWIAKLRLDGYRIDTAERGAWNRGIRGLKRRRKKRVGH